MRKGKGNICVSGGKEEREIGGKERMGGKGKRERER